jgi:hypothetical protein
VLQVDVGGGDEDMDAGPRRPFDGLQGAIDVLITRAGQREDDGRPDRQGDPTDRFEIAIRRSREPRLDDVDAQALELPGDDELLLDVHRRAG